MSDRRRRVLMIAPTSFFLDYGCHVRILEEARALLAQDLRVRIVTYYKGNDWPGLDIVRCRPTPWRADYEVGSSRHKIVFDVLLFWKALEETLRWRPHLIHSHLHEGALIGSVLGRMARVPVLFDFQGSLTSEMVDHGFVTPDTFGYYWWRRLEERIVQMPDVVITSTTHSAELLNRVFARSDGVYPVPDSVNLDFFTPDRLPVEERARRRAALGIPADRRVVVYLGLLADYQGIPQLIRAAAYLRKRDYPVSFLIMGFPGEEAYRQQAARMGLKPPDIIFTGRTPYADAPDHLALGDVGVAPKISTTEGSGKILNYMAMGLPVVAYKSNVSQEYLGKLGVYAEPLGDATALAQALAFALRNPDVASTMGRGSRERAGRHFSWSRTGRELLKIYSMLWERSST